MYAINGFLTTIDTNSGKDEELLNNLLISIEYKVKTAIKTIVVEELRTIYKRVIKGLKIIICNNLNQNVLPIRGTPLLPENPILFAMNSKTINNKAIDIVFNLQTNNNSFFKLVFTPYKSNAKLYSFEI